MALLLHQTPETVDQMPYADVMDIITVHEHNQLSISKAPKSNSSAPERNTK